MEGSDTKKRTFGKTREETFYYLDKGEVKSKVEVYPIPKFKVGDKLWMCWCSEKAELVTVTRVIEFTSGAEYDVVLEGYPVPRNVMEHRLFLTKEEAVNTRIKELKQCIAACEEGIKKLEESIE